jgi:IclR family transcriptional regulator, acetate operon repressor
MIRTVTRGIRNAQQGVQARSGGVQAVERACRLLLEVIRAGEPLTVGDLSRLTGLHQSTTSRLLVSLERLELVERDGVRGKVRTGSRLIELIVDRSFRQALLDAAEPVLGEIGVATNETVTLSVPVAGGLVDNIAQVDAPYILATTNWVGRFVPLHASSAGKVFLAFRTAELPAGRLEQLTPATITDRGQLEAELGLVRRRGFATLIDELEPGLRAVAVPVTDGRGDVVAAIGVSGPSVRLPRQRLREIAGIITQAAVALNSRLVATTPSRRAGPAPLSVRR